MPRKNKKTKPVTETKATFEKENTQSLVRHSTEDLTDEKPEKKSLFLSLDKKLKLQVKKQKKKERKQAFETGKKKIPEEVSMVPSVEWLSTTALQEVEKEQGTLVEDVVLVSQAEVIDDASLNSPEMSEEEEKSLREFLKTLDLMQEKSASQTETKVEAQVVKNKFHIETIPEDLFEEFIENEEMAQARDAIRAFPRTSPLHSPKTRRREPTVTEAVVHPPPKVCYNVHGMAYMTSSEKSTVEDDSDDGIVIINTYRSSEQEIYPRRLDVILEETSDMSDTSGPSEKRSRATAEHGKKGSGEIARTFPSKRERKDGTSVDVTNGRDSCTVQPVVTEKLKMSDDVVKIELAESESEGDFDINQSEASYSVGEVEIVNVEDENSDGVKSSIMKSWKEDDKETSSWSVKTASSDSYRVGEEEWESWRSSLNPDGSCDGVEGDVESELDSQKALILGDVEEFKLSDLLNDKGVEIFITDVKKTGEVKTASRDRKIEDPPIDDGGFFHKSVTSGTDQAKQRDAYQESDYADLGLRPKIGETIQTGVSVRNLTEAIKDDMDKILFTKIKVIKYAEEPRFRESSWGSVLKETKDQLESKNSSITIESNLKRDLESESSSYENVPKFEKIIRVVRMSPEKRQNPEALSNLAEKKVLALPYGKMVLKKIGLGSCCSNDSESGKEAEEDSYEKSSPAADSNSNFRKSEDEEFDEDQRSYIEFDYSNPKMGETEKWYGMRTAVPAVLVGLSPSQRKAYEEKQKRWLTNEAEAESLLDLHRKFIERRSYHETRSWSRERNLVYDSAAHEKGVSITEISNMKRKNENVEKPDKAKEKKIVKQCPPSPNKSERLPGKTVLRLVGNEKSRTEDGVLKSKCCSVKDDEKESNGSRAREEERETNMQNEKDCEVVGKSRLLAILQNAISDDFVPELNTDCSIRSSCENHEVPLTQSQKTRMDDEGKSQRTSKHDAGVENSLRRDQKTFQDFWNREKTYCCTENGRNRVFSRPKTICCENESELYLSETKFVKEVRPPRNAPIEEKEELIITENLPAVSEIIRSFEEPKIRRPLADNSERRNKKTEIQIDNERYQISQKGDIALIQSDPLERKKMQKEKRKSMPVPILSEKEIFKQKMYDEYMSKLAERIGRRQQKVIKLSQSNEIECPEESKFLDLENEFFTKVKERKAKLCIAENDSSRKELYESLKKSCQEFRSYWEGEISNLEEGKVAFREKEDIGGTESTNSKRSSIQLLDTSSDLENLPKHLKELLQVDEEEFPDFFDGKSFENMPSSVLFSPTFKATAPRPGVWSPARTVSDDKTEEREENEERKKLENEPIPPVWTPRSAQASPVLEKKEFRPVNFESPTLPRKKYIQDDKKESSVPPPWQQPGGDKPPQLVKSPSSPALSLPRAPNPTVTLLQKAREGYLPRGAHYLNSDMNESPASDGTTRERLEIVSSVKTEPDRSRKTETGPKKIIGIGPTTKEGIPLVLRSEVTEENKEKWYKRMYDSLHKYGKDDDYVTVKYRTSPRRKVSNNSDGNLWQPLAAPRLAVQQMRSQYTYWWGTAEMTKNLWKFGLYNYQHGSSSGYLSEPESLSYDISNNKYVTLDRRRNEKSQEKECLTLTLPRSRTSPPRRDFREYKNQPGRIEDYEPGHSSISELEANKWWDEVLEIFDKWLDRSPGQESAYNSLLIDTSQSRREEEKNRPVVRKLQSPRSFINYASGYVSDPQYVYKRTEEELQSPPSSEEQKEAYRIIQKGGEIPLRGLRKPAPERPKDSINTEIEYFPLSPTLTRIRVHKQNITPLSELPFSLYSLPYDSATLNFPSLPFGVCSSFSQVQLFPPPILPQLSIGGLGSEASPGKDQKFSVQLQNISGPEDYVQIVPKPRSQPKKSPIYANVPARNRNCSPDPGSFESEVNQSLAPETGNSFSAKNLADSAVSVKRDTDEKGFKRGGFATFSDLKRIAPSINSAAISKISLSKIPTKQRKTESSAEKSKESAKKRVLISKLTSKSPVRLKKTSAENKENFSEKKKSLTEKGSKKEKKKTEVKVKETATKKDKTKVPLSESVQREKPLAKSNKRLKTLSDTLKTRKAEAKSNQKDFSEIRSPTFDKEKDVIECLTRVVEYSNPNHVNLKNPEVRTVSFQKSEEEGASMSPVYETIEHKPKIGSDMTEVFRSRSFSPDVKRKIFKFPDMNKPLPPKRKESKMSPTLKLWSKMMVSYPRHKSRLESFDSNVKFFGDRIKRKLANDKDTNVDFGDNIETVRTVKKDKNGDMSIKTSRYLKLAQPASPGLISARATYPDIERRKLLSEPRMKFGSVDSIQPRKYSDASTVSKTVGSDARKAAKKLDTVLRSSTTYSVRNPTREDDDKRKSVKVTVAISSKGKELSRKGAGANPPVRTAVSKSSSSPCPSISSFRSGVSGKSDKGSTSSQERVQSPQTRLISPNSSTSRLSNLSRSTSPGSAVSRSKVQKQTLRKPSAPPVVSKGEIKTKLETKTRSTNIGKTVSKSLGKPLISEETSRTKEEMKKREKKSGNGKTKTIVHKKSPEIATEKEANEVVRGRDLIRTDSFFQNLFLRGSVEKKPVVELERTTSVLERARRYQRKLNWPETYKSEPSLSLVTYYLNQKRPVYFSKFRNWDREGIPFRYPSPLGNFHYENFQMKLRRFDSMSQFGDGLQRDLSPEAKERSLSEPPIHRSHTTSPEQKPESKSSKVSLSEASSMRSSPNSSRSPSSRRIHSYRSSQRADEGGRDVKKVVSRARSAGEIEELKPRGGLQCGDLGKSSSSLNLSNLSDHTEYQAYVLELMHSSRKCERFRELHKFYSNLERMGKLEKTASTGDLRPRLRNEEIIDFDRWKKIRTKERAEAELKALVDNLVKVQKEKDLLFRASDVEAVRWKGDSGLRIKERSVEDLREQFSKYSEENLDPCVWKREVDVGKDHYKPFWRGSSIVDVASNLNKALVSHRGRPISLQELEKIEKSKARIGKEYGYSLKAWSSLSNEQVNALKDQLSEIYAQDSRKRYLDGSVEDLPDKYEIFVPKGSDVQSPGESSLQVRCNSALSKSQTYTPTIKRKEELRKEWKKADSIGALPTAEDISLPQLPWKDERKIDRSHSEGRSERRDRYPLLRSKSASSSRPLSENEKKRLSMTLSKEVIEKMTKAGGKGPLFPRETLGALAVAGSKLREHKLTEGATGPLEEWTNGNDEMVPKDRRQGKGQESGSGSSEASIKTVIRKNSMDVLKKVQYFEDLQQSADDFFDSDYDFLESQKKSTEAKSSKDRKDNRSSKGKKKNVLITSSSMENLNDFFGQQKQYTTSPIQNKPAAKPASHTTSDASKALMQIPLRGEDLYDQRHIFDEKKWLPLRYYSTSPVQLRSGSSNDSLFSCRSRSVSPDPTKYYRAYLRMVKCGAVRKLCNKFESWEDLLSMSSDRDFWLPPPPRRFASDPELTRDLLKRFGTDPTKVTIRGQEVGDVRWLRTKFERDLYPTRGRTRFRRTRSPLVKSPLTVADRFMPRINVISKTAELQMQGLPPERKQKDSAPPKANLQAAPPEDYRSLIDYTKDHGGYYYTGEVEKLRRKFERLQEAERLSILGQMYTSAPNVNELRDIAPYLECSWIAHRYPGVSKTASSPEIPAPRQESPKKPELKPRPHSSSPIRPKQPSSILKSSCTYPDRFANQKFDPSIHRPKYRYQPEREIDRRYKRGDPDWCRHWNKPTVTFKESVSFKSEPEIRDLSPESPRKYVESEVTIHYKSPVRSEAKAILSEDELARRQAESMKRMYKEERRRKYLQELQDMNSRRHTDNFIPSQKSPISLNRYDDFPADASTYYRREYSTDPVLVARGLYDFVGRRPRELGFRRGDIIFIIRKLDKNWCEGELNGVVGLFPLSYVEVIPYSEINLKYGRARAKYDFIPQTSLELLARKGDMITLLRKIDENWFEGRIGERTGIIPASYCHVLAMPQATRLQPRVEKSIGKPVAAPAAHSLIHNGSGLTSKHYYAPYLSPSSPGRSTTSSTSVNYHPSADMLIDEALMQLDEEFDLKRSSKPASQPLNVRINPRPEPELYQVLFNHVPNNDDELELVQGETVTVVEKCGDGWYIGNKSDGKLGIFPGTHVRRIGPEFV